MKVETCCNEVLPEYVTRQRGHEVRVRGPRSDGLYEVTDAGSGYWRGSYSKAQVDSMFPPTEPKFSVRVIREAVARYGNYFALADTAAGLRERLEAIAEELEE